jgi:bifunctional DNA-binding transcriptional regulator/antitoxin component of YhaV-PrlF toxin-antitoxin module
MARESLIAGNVKIRAYYTKAGFAAVTITLPHEVCEKFGWQPGQYLTYYPTTGRELVLVSQDQHLLHVSPDYDLKLASQGKELPGPKPGSVAEVYDIREKEWQDAMDKLGRGEAPRFTTPELPDLEPVAMPKPGPQPKPRRSRRG